jgi:hypothetical protein
MITSSAGDLYREGRATTTLLLNCGGDAYSSAYEVVVVDRSTDGAPYIRDLVVNIHENRVRVTALRVANPGAVDVQVTFPDDEGAPVRQQQWRTFSWDGHRFGQTAGATSFENHPRATKLAVAATPLRFQAAAGGGYGGNTIITVHNHGANPVAKAILQINALPGVAPESNEVGEATDGPVRYWTLQLGPIDPGGTQSVNVRFSLAAPGTQIPQTAIMLILATGWDAAGLSMVEIGDESLVYVTVIRP